MKYPKIHDWFTAIAQEKPEQVAIARQTQNFTYHTIDKKSNNLASFLVESGATPGSIIVILAQDTVEVITAILATLKAGCVFVPLDPNTPQGRLNAIASSIKPQFWLTEFPLVEKIQQIETNLIENANLILLDKKEIDPTQTKSLIPLTQYRNYDNPTNPKIDMGLDDLCYIYFTSGSTGKPKGIAGRLKAISHFIDWEINTLQLQEIRSSQLVTPSFDAFLRDIFVPLCCGGTACLPPGKDTILDSRKLIQWINEQQINLIHCVPSVFRSLLNQDLNSDQFSQLKYILMAGEPLLPADVKQWIEIFGDRTQLVNLYGASETTMTKFYYFVQPEDGQRKSIPVGKPIEGAKLLLINPDGNPCEPGIEGEIYVQTPYRTLGYYQQPELTKKVFVPNPVTGDQSDIVYKTGDLGKILPDGNLAFLGRKDFQVKIRGVRIELGEIENLLRSHPEVQDVVVTDREDTGGNKYLCAYTVLGQPTETGTLREYLLKNLPEYMIPSSFVILDALPRNINGKVDRKSLPDPRDIKRDRIAPRNELEQKIAQVWQEILGLEEVGVTNNFFELGGHSLLAVRLCSALEDKLQKEVPVAALFRSPTVEGLANLLSQENLNLQGSSIISIQPKGSKTPLFGIHVLGQGMQYYRPLVKHLGEDQPVYGLALDVVDEGQGGSKGVKELSEIYIKDMQTLQPEGPYSLIGVSFGGRVAFEMAQQLQAKGEKVAFLGLLDTTARTGVQHLPVNDRVSGHWEKLKQEGPSYITKKLTARMGRIKYRFKAMTVKVYKKLGMSLSDELQTVATRERNILIKKQHFPQPYTGVITLFRAMDRKAEVGTVIDPQYGWGEIAVGGLEIYDIPGDHLRMLQEPNVQVLAEKIKEFIEQNNLSRVKNR